MERPAILLFDLGGVLVDNIGFECLRSLSSSPIQIGQLKANWLASPAVRSFERGLSSPELFAAQFVQDWHLSLTPDEFLELFSSWPRGFYPGAAELLALLRGRFRLACLSNSNVIHWQRLEGVRGCFDVSLSSHLLGEVKPDTACFELAVQLCGAESSTVAFFDDSIANVTAARAVGIQSFHVNGLAEVERVLVGEGWLHRASANT